jgi:hypothetical protein
MRTRVETAKIEKFFTCVTRLEDVLGSHLKSAGLVTFFSEQWEVFAAV